MKKKSIINIIPFLVTGFLAIFITACTHYYYVPDILNVPLFKEKNEFRLSGGIGLGDESSSKEIQLAYSVTDKIGIMADFMSVEGGEVSVNEDWARGNYFGGGIGYFKPVGKFGVFEIYGGLGFSKQDHIYAQNGTSNLKFTKLFLQPSYGYSFKGFDIAVSTRISNINYNKIDNNIDFQADGYEFERVNSLAGQKSYLFLEPAITVRGGWKYLKVQAQYAAASYTKRNLPFEDYHVSFGLYFAIADRYANKVSK